MTGALLVLLTLSSPTAAAADSTWMASAPTQGSWVTRAQVGWPWSSAQTQVGLSERFSLQVTATTAVLRRWHGQAGLGCTLLRAPRLHLSGALLAGGVLQPGGPAGAQPIVGPQVEVQVRAAVPLRVMPWVSLASQHLVQVETTHVLSASGESVERDFTHLWTPWLKVGAGIPLGERLGLELGVDLARVDGAFALPGLHGAVALRSGS